MHWSGDFRTQTHTHAHFWLKVFTVFLPRMQVLNSKYPFLLFGEKCSQVGSQHMYAQYAYVYEDRLPQCCLSSPWLCLVALCLILVIQIDSVNDYRVIGICLRWHDMNLVGTPARSSLRWGLTRLRRMLSKHWHTDGLYNFRRRNSCHTDIHNVIIVI